ncbi:MAG TPA: hypothetical protein VM491_15825, partial [Burkholderiaceae bacterium]|nr:hypothetical protein [Burkholderiaceae bacterium]
TASSNRCRLEFAAAAFSARQAWRAAANSSRHLFELAVLGDPALALQVQRCEPHDARALQRRLYLAGAAEWRRIRRNA